MQWPNIPIERFGEMAFKEVISSKVVLVRLAKDAPDPEKGKERSDETTSFDLYHNIVVFHYDGTSGMR